MAKFESLHDKMRAVERALSVVRADALANEFERVVIDQIDLMLQAANEARLLIREYEYAMNREEQFVAAHEAKKYLVKVQQGIVVVSQYDLLGPADVAQLSAEAHAIADALQ